MREKHLSRWKNLKKRFYNTIEKEIKKDTAHKVALGCALGIGVNFFPTLGFGFIFAYLLAVLFRVNRASAATTSLITAPFIPLMYSLSLLIGGLILTPVTGNENLREFIIEQYSIMLRLGNIREKIFSFLDFFGSTFLLGSAIAATIFGIGCYFFVSFMFNKKMQVGIKNKRTQYNN